MTNLNYHHLYYFYVTAKSGSITKACETLFLSQPAVSTQLRQLEHSLGYPLFDRKKQRLHLTEHGRFILDYAEAIFDLGRELQDNLNNRKRGLRDIRAGILNGTPRAFGHALLECLLDGFPDAYVHVQEGKADELLPDIDELRLDFLLADMPMHGRDPTMISNHLVGKVPFVLAVSPAIARHYRRLPRDLNGAPFILPSWPGHIYQQTLDILAEWHVKPKVIIEVQDAELARRLVMSGRGVAPLNAYAAFLGKEPLTILTSPKPFNLQDSVYLVSRRRQRPNPVVEYLTGTFRLPPIPDAARRRN